MKNTTEMSSNDIAGEFGNITWIVKMKPEGGFSHVKVEAHDEQSACLTAEDKFGGTALSAKPVRTVWSSNPALIDPNTPSQRRWD